MDRFEVLEQVGEGASGEVCRARDRETGRVVALKILRKDASTERFDREARILAELAHPNIVAYVAHGPDYLAMEWLEGETLAQRIDSRPLTLKETTGAMKKIALALSAIHAVGIVHRDVKPSNIMLAPDAKLLDFSVARARDRHRTASGVVIGTLSYMAPEQARGDRDVDARADVFGLGCVLYECVTGRLPFDGETALEVRIAVISKEPPRVRALRPELPAEIDTLVHGMLEKDPARRNVDCGFAAKVLAGLARHDAPPPPPRIEVVSGSAETQVDSRRIA